MSGRIVGAEPIGTVQNTEEFILKAMIAMGNQIIEIHRKLEELSNALNLLRNRVGSDRGRRNPL